MPFSRNNFHPLMDNSCICGNIPWKYCEMKCKKFVLMGKVLTKLFFSKCLGFVNTTNQAVLRFFCQKNFYCMIIFSLERRFETEKSNLANSN